MTTAQTTQSAPPSRILRSIIGEGTLRNRVGEYVNFHLRNTGDSWYAKEVAGSGVDEAERKLAEWIAERGLNTFADSVSQVASGLLALAKLDDNRPEPEENDGDRRRKPEPPHVRTVSLTEGMDLPGAYRHNGGVLILGTNPHVPGCGCSQPK